MNPETGGRPTITALVVSYNAADDLRNCVQSLMESDLDAVWVIDNASTESDAIAALHELDDQFGAGSASPAFHAVFSQENTGFGGGINRLTEHAGASDFWWFVNPDAVVEPQVGRTVVDAMQRHDLGLASPVITTGENAETIWFAGGTLHRETGLCEHVTVRDEKTEIVESSFLTGAAMFVRGDVWARLGGFDASLFLYWEDADLTARANDLGIRSATVMAAQVWHRVGGGGSEESSAVYYHYMHRNRLVVCGRYTRRRSLLVGRGARYTVRLLRASMRERTNPLQKTLSGLRGAAVGLRTRGAGVAPHAGFPRINPEARL